MATFTYDVTVRWSGDLGSGTSAYAVYGRDHSLEVAGAPAIAGSADPHFRGTPGRWTPEETFVGAIAACHQLWYLHLCSEAGIVVRAYVDRATGTMTTERSGGGRFTLVTLRPQVAIERGSADRAGADRARALHDEAHALCFIANSVSVPIAIEPAITLA